MIRLVFLSLILLAHMSSSAHARIECFFAGNKTESNNARLGRITYDSLQDYIRYTDETGSRYVNIGVSEGNAKDQEYSLHVVTAQSGKPIVKVKKTEKPMVLFLASNYIETWHVDVE